MASNVQESGAPRWSRAGWATGAAMVASALVAKQFVGEPDWVDTLAQTGALLIGIGVAAELVARTTGERAYRAALGLAAGTALLLVLANGAVGIIGSEDNTANLMYGGVLLVGVLGAIIARFNPRGMSRALVAAAVAQGLVAMIAVAGGLGSPASGPLEIVTINGIFVALFVGSAMLFAKAERGRPDRVAA